MWTELDRREVKSSRKCKCCIWCGEAINVGEPKLVVTGIYDGDFQANDYHPECSDGSRGYFARPEVDRDMGIDAGSMVRGKHYAKDEREYFEPAVKLKDWAP